MNVVRKILAAVEDPSYRLCAPGMPLGTYEILEEACAEMRTSGRLRMGRQGFANELTGVIDSRRVAGFWTDDDDMKNCIENIGCVLEVLSRRNGDDEFWVEIVNQVRSKSEPYWYDLYQDYAPRDEWPEWLSAYVGGWTRRLAQYGAAINETFRKHFEAALARKVYRALSGPCNIRYATVNSVMVQDIIEEIGMRDCLPPCALPKIVEKLSYCCSTGNVMFVPVA